MNRNFDKILTKYAPPLVILAAFGLVYNRYIEIEEDRPNSESQTALQVAFGSGITIAISALLIGWKNALKVFLCFTISGVPMIIGYALRHRTRQGRCEV